MECIRFAHGNPVAYGVRQKMDTKSLTGLPGDPSLMAFQASPEAAGIVNQLMSAQEGVSGISGVLKKVLGKQQGLKN